MHGVSVVREKAHLGDEVMLKSEVIKTITMTISKLNLRHQSYSQVVGQ